MFNGTVTWMRAFGDASRWQDGDVSWPAAQRMVALWPAAEADELVAIERRLSTDDNGFCDRAQTKHR